MEYEEEENKIETYKIILLGDADVGKTALINRFSDEEFHENYISTIGVDFRYKDINVDGDIVRLQVWDTAGQERFRAISTHFYRGAHGVFIVYAVDNMNSFQNARSWLENINSNTSSNEDTSSSSTGPPSVVKCLVGNKADLVATRSVDEERGKCLAEIYDVKFVETSAKSSQNVNEMFLNMARDIKANTCQPKFLGPKIPMYDKTLVKHHHC